MEGGPASSRAHKGEGSTVGAALGQRDWRPGLGWVDAKPTEPGDPVLLSIRRNPEPQGKESKGEVSGLQTPSPETTMALLQMQVPGGNRLQLTPQAWCHSLTSTDTGVPEDNLVVQRHPQCVLLRHRFLRWPDVILGRGGSSR